MSVARPLHLSLMSNGQIIAQRIAKKGENNEQTKIIYIDRGIFLYGFEFAGHRFGAVTQP